MIQFALTVDEPKKMARGSLDSNEMGCWWQSACLLPPLPALVIACPPTMVLPVTEPGVGGVPPDNGLLTFRS